ncbi:MAG: hypothetical protein QXF85_01860, partial [Candidatus Micrarchaeaceae archaeon]
MIGDSYIMRRYNIRSSAIYAVLSNKSYLAAFIAIFFLSLAAYSYLLSGSSVNLAMPKIILGLNAYALAASISISVLLSLSIVMDIFAFEKGAASEAKLGIGAVVAAIIPGSLCCTSVIPAILAAAGASTTTIIGAAGALQGPFAAYE